MEVGNLGEELKRHKLIDEQIKVERAKARAFRGLAKIFEGIAKAISRDL